TRGANSPAKVDFGMASVKVNGSFATETASSRPWASTWTANWTATGNGGARTASPFKQGRSLAANKLVCGNATTTTGNSGTRAPTTTARRWVRGKCTTNMESSKRAKFLRSRNDDTDIVHSKGEVMKKSVIIMLVGMFVTAAGVLSAKD